MLKLPLEDKGMKLSSFINNSLKIHTSPNLIYPYSNQFLSMLYTL